MKDPTYLSVRNTLAEYLHVHPTQIRPDQNLERDLGLQHLERNELALRLEEQEDIGIRDSELEQVRTVGQLVALVRSIRRREELEAEVTRVRSRRGTRGARTAAANTGAHRLRSHG